MTVKKKGKNLTDTETETWGQRHNNTSVIIAVNDTGWKGGGGWTDGRCFDTKRALPSMTLSEMSLGSLPVSSYTLGGKGPHLPTEYVAGFTSIQLFDSVCLH